MWPFFFGLNPSKPMGIEIMRAKDKKPIIALLPRGIARAVRGRYGRQDKRSAISSQSRWFLWLYAKSIMARARAIRR